MDRNRIEGAADKAKGAAKDATGKVIGNDRLRAEGKIDKAGSDAVRQASKH